MRRKKAPSRQALSAAVPLRSPQPREVRTEGGAPLSLEPSEQNVSKDQGQENRPDAPAVAAELGLNVPPILFEGDDPQRPPTINAEIKYALAPAPPAVQTSPERQELPAAYGTGRLLAMARDPHCLYVHWDLTPEQQKQLNGLFQHHRLFVRVRQEGHVTKPPFEVAIQPEARHWFLQAETSGATYVAELGYYGPGQEWKPVEASRPVRTPPEYVSTQKGAQFATFNPDVPLPSAAKEGGIQVFGNQTGFEPQQQTIPKQPSPQPTPIPREFPLVARPEPVRQPVVSRIDTPERVTPSPALADIVAEDLGPEWTPSQEQALEALIGWAPASKESAGSAEIEHLLRREIRRPLVSPAQLSLEAILEQALPVAISSPTGGEQLRPVGFWLNVNAELIVYGATDPNARLTLGGQAIQLRPDGTFSCRFALPDGQFELPVAAESPSGEKRQVRLLFGRSTTFEGEVGTGAQDPALRRAGDKDTV